jgi:hypothetical protein
MSHFARKRTVTFAALIYIFLMIILSAIYGRRGMLIDYMLLLTFMLLIRLRSPMLGLNDRFKIYFSGFIIIMMLLITSSIIKSSYAFQRGFNQEAFEASRGRVFQDFFEDFNTTSDWIFGRGIDGTVLRTINIDTGAENLIENGILTIILKGGLIYMIPYVLLFLGAIYYGFFRSNNDLCKSLAAILLIHLVIMFQFNLPDYSSKYVFVWIAISTCFNPAIRALNNETLYMVLNLNRKW